MKKLFTFILTSLFSISLIAQEGMWLLSQIKDLNLNEKGLEISVDEIYHPNKSCLADAVVQVGATGSFVSSDGLLLTNHHVAFRAIQHASSKDNDYLTNGFLARTQNEEIEAPGYSVYLLLEMKDVTEEIILSCKGVDDPVEKVTVINTKIQEIKENIENEKTDISARVSSMYNGKQYVLYVRKRFDDVRIVYAPPKSIGTYGGDIDNLMWPRHTGDFTFLRVYVAPDGTGRKYHKENIPYKPEKWLKIAEKPLKKGDFTFILGYPGHTTRFRTSNSVKWNLEKNYPVIVNDLKEVIKILNEFSQNNAESKIKLATLETGLNNGMKMTKGKMEGMIKSNFLQKKIHFEKELMRYIEKDTLLNKKYGNILNAIEEEYEVLNKNTKYNQALININNFAGTLSQIAHEIYYNVKEREKSKDKRNPYFSEKSVTRMVQQLENKFSSYYEPADKALLYWALNKANSLPSDSRIKGLDNFINDQDLKNIIDELYKNTKLKDIEFAKTLYAKSSKELDALNDPFIEFAKMLYDDNELLRKSNQKFSSAINELRKQFIDAIYEWKGKTLYPDANGTIRSVYGTVEGFKPRDAVQYEAFTSLAGVIEKNTYEEPFNVPQKLIELYEKKDYGQWLDPELGDVPVAFIHHGDLTGGSSGSPVLNAKGELVGLVFDGNYEAMANDWQYDYDLQRAISVDIRYVLFITEKFANAQHILKELEIK